MSLRSKLLIGLKRSGEKQFGDCSARTKQSCGCNQREKSRVAAQLRRLLALALILEGRKEEGLASLHMALAAGPRRPEVWRSLCGAFAEAGETSAAAACRRAAEDAAK